MALSLPSLVAVAVSVSVVTLLLVFCLICHSVLLILYSRKRACFSRHCACIAKMFDAMVERCGRGEVLSDEDDPPEVELHEATQPDSDDQKLNEATLETENEREALRLVEYYLPNGVRSAPPSRNYRRHDPEADSETTISIHPSADSDPLVRRRRVQRKDGRVPDVNVSVQEDDSDSDPAIKIVRDVDGTLKRFRRRSKEKDLRVVSVGEKKYLYRRRTPKEKEEFVQMRDRRRNATSEAAAAADGAASSNASSSEENQPAPAPARRIPEVTVTVEEVEEVEEDVRPAVEMGPNPDDIFSVSVPVPSVKEQPQVAHVAPIPPVVHVPSESHPVLLVDEVEFDSLQLRFCNHCITFDCTSLTELNEHMKKVHPEQYRISALLGGS